MLRRVHLPRLSVGAVALPSAEAHHLRDVLRVTAGETIELFDDAGLLATGLIKHVNSANVVVQIDSLEQSATAGLRVSVAAAIPKGDRADWMVEKLTELGVARFIPLATERSVVLPAGKNKIERWERIAVESAKQSRRSGVMSIAPLTTLAEVLKSNQSGLYFSTAQTALPIRQVLDGKQFGELLLLIGPEGGWTTGEEEKMHAAGLMAAKLTDTVLRVETAAVTAAGVILCTI
jgi:16S rRNA (uracil1498-N3)-methyltransferase